LFVRGLKLLVCGSQLLVRSFELLKGCLRLFPGSPELAFEVPDCVFRTGIGRWRLALPRAASRGHFLEDDHVEVSVVELPERLHGEVNMTYPGVRLHGNVLLLGSLSGAHGSMERRAQRNPDAFTRHVDHVGVWTA